MLIDLFISNYLSSYIVLYCCVCVSLSPTLFLSLSLTLYLSLSISHSLTRYLSLSITHTIPLPHTFSLCFCCHFQICLFFSYVSLHVICVCLGPNISTSTSYFNILITSLPYFCLLPTTFLLIWLIPHYLFSTSFEGAAESRAFTSDGQQAGFAKRSLTCWGEHK